MEQEDENLESIENRKDSSDKRLHLREKITRESESYWDVEMEQKEE